MIYRNLGILISKKVFVTKIYGIYNLHVTHILKVERLFLIARLARSDPRNHFSVGTYVSIYSILVYFIMFSFQVLTCLRIVSIRIILNLNKFRQVGTCSDMFENHNNSYHIESEQVQTCLRII